MENQCLDLFEKLFNSGCGGCYRECVCGLIYFDYYNVTDWEEGELNCMLAMQLKNPEKYIAVDHSIGTMEILDNQIVIGCQCRYAKNFENFILDHGIQIAEYLNTRAEALKEKAKSIEVNNG